MTSPKSCQELLAELQAAQTATPHDQAAEDAAQAAYDAAGCGVSQTDSGGSGGTTTPPRRPG